MRLQMSGAVGVIDTWPLIACNGAAEPAAQACSSFNWIQPFTGAIAVGLFLLALKARRKSDYDSFKESVAQDAKLLSRIAASDPGGPTSVTANLEFPRFPEESWWWWRRLRRRLAHRPRDWLRVQQFRMVRLSKEPGHAFDVAVLRAAGLSRRDVINAAIAKYSFDPYTAEELPDKHPDHPGRRQPATIVALRTHHNYTHAYLVVEPASRWRRVKRSRQTATTETRP